MGDKQAIVYVTEELDFSGSDSDYWFSEDESDSEFEEELLQQSRASRITQVIVYYSQCFR